MSTRFIPSAFVMLLLTAAPTRAAVTCVSNTNELLAALDLAESNGEDDSLLLTDGVYTAPPVGFLYQSSEGKGLSISGGYIDLAAIGCVKYGPRPNQTILDAPDNGPALVLVDQSSIGNPVFEIEDVVLADGKEGLRFQNGTASVGSHFELDRVVMQNLAGPTFFAEVRGALRMWNTLMVLNGTPAAPATGGGVIRLQGSTSTAVLTHNTFSRNRFAAASRALKVWCDGGPASIDVTNNIIRDNGTAVTDLDVESECDLALTFNSYDSLVGGADTSCCNTNLMPAFVDAINGDFRLRWDAALRNIGDLTPTGGLPAMDFFGYQRPDGLLPDLGAHEFPWIFADGFETGNTSKWSAVAP